MSHVTGLKETNEKRARKKQQLVLSTMPPDLASVENEYAKNANLRKNDVQAIFDWLKKQPHLPELTELQAILFLHSCHYHIEAAKTIIDNYFTIRTHCFYLFSCASEEIIRNVLAIEAMTILPRQTPEGYTIFSAKLLDNRSEKYVCVDHLKVATMVLTLNLHKYGSVKGFVFLFDTKGATLGHLARVNLTAVKQIINFIQEAAPLRIQSIQYVNVEPFTEKAVGLLKQLLKSEFFNLIHLHSSLDSLYKRIPKECLPEDYGGDLPLIQNLQEKNIQNLVDNLDFFHWHDTQKIDDSKRPEKTDHLNLSTTYGMEGTFKKLEID